MKLYGTGVEVTHVHQALAVVEAAVVVTAEVVATGLFQLNHLHLVWLKFSSFSSLLIMY